MDNKVIKIYGDSYYDNDHYDEHPCPYRQDVHNDNEYRCTCSPEKTQQCADDI